MKIHFLASVLLISTATSVLGLGTIDFRNRTAIGKGQRIYSWHGGQGMPIRGDAFTAGLFAQREGRWVEIARSIFRDTDADAGLLVGAIVKVDWINAGDRVNLIVRFWETRAGSSEALCLPENFGVERGESPVINDYIAGGDRDGTPILQKSLIDAGLQSFGSDPWFSRPADCFPEPPELLVSFSRSSVVPVVIRWPYPFTAYRLEESELLQPEGSAQEWSVVAEAPTRGGDYLYVSLRKSDRNRFFRLVKP
jgi:hypothetical protein